MKRMAQGPAWAWGLSIWLVMAPYSWCAGTELESAGNPASVAETATDTTTAAPMPASTAKGTLWQSLHDHLEIGTRVTGFTLLDTHRPNDPAQRETFLGHLNVLTEDEDSWPNKFLVDYMFNRYVGVECAYDKVAAHTINADTHPGDGVVRLAGPIYSLVLRYPMHDTYIPYATIGVADWNGGFEHEEWWNRGWASAQDFLDAGQPPGNHNSKARVISVTDETPLAYSGGCLVRLARYVDLDFMIRYVNVTTHATFDDSLGGQVIVHRVGEFPLSNIAYGGGLRLVF